MNIDKLTNEKQRIVNLINQDFGTELTVYNPCCPLIICGAINKQEPDNFIFRSRVDTITASVGLDCSEAEDNINGRGPASRYIKRFKRYDLSWLTGDELYRELSLALKDFGICHETVQN